MAVKDKESRHAALRNWEPRASTVYCWTGMAFALIAGSFPILGLEATRSWGYVLLGVACAMLVVALALLLVKMVRES